MAEEIDEPIRRHNRWVWPDGTTLPVVSGGDGETDPLASAGGTEPPAVEPPAPAGEPAATEPDPFDDPAAATFDRAYVERLRRSEAGYRTKAKEAEERAAALAPFAALDPDDAGMLATFAHQVINDPAEAARMAAGWATNLTPAEQREVAAAVGADDSTPLTKADVLAVIAEAREADRVAQAQTAIDADAARLGFPPGHRDYIALLWEAHNNHGGDLDKAAGAIASDRQKVIDDYVAAKTAQAGGPATAPTGSAPGTVVGAPKSLAEARRSALARIDEALRSDIGQ